MEKKIDPFFSPESIKVRLDKNPFSKLSDIVRDILEEAIVKLYIIPGEKINMAAIAEALDVSRAPVREALNTLVKDGLVVIKPNVNGYYALNINDKYMDNLFVARATIEVAATKLCAARFHSIDRAHLKECCDIFKKCYKTKDYDAFVDADRDMHQSLVNYSDNSFLIEMYNGLGRAMEYYTSFSRFYLKRYGNNIFDDFELMIGEHIAIYNAVCMGFVSAAAEAAQRHLETCNSSFIHYYLSKGTK